VCAHCDALTYAQHTTTIMQSNLKKTPPPFIQEIQNDLRVAVEAAKHIILFGYSLPPDDVTYRAFFAARKKRGNVRCSVVVGTEFEDVWYEAAEIDDLLKEMKKNEPPATTLHAARDIFGKDNVRFYGGGIPNVFCDGNKADKEKFHRLINW
jgi:alkanesulfonate monooxygenase SsuD/methylene tetrahydromethanopterin reductase-like flavin-dependent oxidoreductase (luciferase family)